VGATLAQGGEEEKKDPRRENGEKADCGSAGTEGARRSRGRRVEGGAVAAAAPSSAPRRSMTRRAMARRAGPSVVGGQGAAWLGGGARLLGKPMEERRAQLGIRSPGRARPPR
jgi:hypothetical protein